MHQLYIVTRCLKVLEEIDKALWTGDIEHLISVSRVEGQLGKLFSKEVDVVYKMPVDDVDEMQDIRDIQQGRPLSKECSVCLLPPVTKGNA